MHPSESSLELPDPEKLYEVCSAVWNKGGAVHWDANRPNTIKVVGNPDNIQSLILTVREITSPAPAAPADEAPAPVAPAA